MTQETAGKENASSWLKPVAIPVATALIIAAITLPAGAFINSWVNSRAPYLRYSQTEPVTFEGAQNQFAIVNFSATNDGSKEAENVEYTLSLGDARIHELQVKPEFLNGKATISPDDGSATVRVPHLNPGETLQISALIKEPENLTKIESVVRAKGVTGQEGPKEPGIPIVVSFLMFSTAGLFGLLAGMVHGQMKATGRGAFACLMMVVSRRHRLKYYEELRDELFGGRERPEGR